MLQDLIIVVYLIDVLDQISTTLSMFATISWIILIFILLYCVITEEIETLLDYKKPLIYFVVSLVATSAFTLLIPSKQTMYIMAGLHTANTAVAVIQDNPTAQKAFKLLDAKLDEMQAELENKE